MSAPLKCDLCGYEHEPITIGGIQIVGCPAVPEGWLIPSLPDLLRQVRALEEKERKS